MLVRHVQEKRDPAGRLHFRRADLQLLKRARESIDGQVHLDTLQPEVTAGPAEPVGPWRSSQIEARIGRGAGAGRPAAFASGVVEKAIRQRDVAITEYFGERVGLLLLERPQQFVEGSSGTSSKSPAINGSGRAASGMRRSSRSVCK